ncbi:MAG TPA: hypothetical protein V6C97_26240 [Oculatellaceae cyanobacterium]
MKKVKKSDWRLGTILTELSLLSPEELEVALMMTRSTGMPLGSVLLVTGALTREELRAMIQAQSMLKDKLVDEDKLLAAVPLLKDQKSLGLEGALRRIKWHRDSKAPSNKLGQLLVSAQLISQLELAKGLAHNRNSLQPLGRTLVLIGALSPRALQHALRVQERIRKGELTRPQGVTLLRQVCARNGLKVGAKTSTPQGKEKDAMRLGDLLVEAGLVKEEDFCEAMEISAYKSKLIGEILVESRLLSKPRLQAALELQRLLSMGLVQRNQAIAALSSVDDNTSVAEVLEKNIVEDSKKRLLASEALTTLAAQLTGLKLDDLKLEGRERARTQGTGTVGKFGKGTGSESADGNFSGDGDSRSKSGADSGGDSDVDGAIRKEEQRLRTVAEHLYLDVLNGALDVEQAMIVLNICLKDDCTVPQAVAKMGWTVGARPFKESEINYSESDLIDWLTQEG